jgi:hypothetical protein
MANVFVTIGQMLGMEMQSFGDSTGSFNLNG